jgi:hypothetical protein
MLLRSLLTGSALLLLSACENPPPPNDARAADTPPPAPRQEAFTGCTAKMVERNVVLNCGTLILTLLRVRTAITDTAALANQDRFEQEFPPTMRRERSRPTVAGKECWASQVEEPEAAWAKLLIVPTGPAEGLVLSCGSKARDAMPRCDKMLEDLAAERIPPLVAGALKSSAHATK